MGFKNWLEEIGFPLLDKRAVAGLILFWILVMSVGGCLLVGLSQRLSPESGEQQGLLPRTATQTSTRDLAPLDPTALALSPSPVLLPGQLTGVPLTQTSDEWVFQNPPTQTPIFFTPPPTLMSTNTRVPTATWVIYSFTRIAATSYYRTSTLRPPTITPTRTVTRTPTPTVTTLVPTTHIPTSQNTGTMTPTAPATVTATETTTPTVTTTPTETVTPTSTVTSTETPTPTSTDTPTQPAPDTDTPTVTVTLTATETETPTPTPTETETPTPTATDTATPTPTVVSTVIAFSADINTPAQDGTLDLLRANENGTALAAILADSNSTLMGDWSPDGERIVLEQHSPGSVRLYTVLVNGTGKTLLANQPSGSNSEPRYSPDGQWIAHTNSDPARDSGANNIWLTPVDGSTAFALTSGAASDSQPDWSPDGKTIVFVRNGAIYTLSVAELYPAPDASPGALVDSVFNFFSKALNLNAAEPQVTITATPQPLFTAVTTTGEWPRYAPDGQHLLVVRAGDIIKINLTTRSETNLTASLAGTARTPAWSRDSKRIAFILQTSGGTVNDELWLMSDLGTLATKVPNLDELGAKHRPVWKP